MKNIFHPTKAVFTLEPAMTPLRITHIVDSLERGGLERVVTDLALTQHRSGHRVAVFSLLSTGGFIDELRSQGVEVIEGHKKQGLNWKLLRRLRQQARQSDVFHTHNFVPNYHAAAALVGLRNKPVLIGTCHDMGTRLNKRRLRWLYTWSLKRTQRVAMVGEQVRQRYVQSGLVPFDKAVTVLNAVPVERFGAGNSQAATLQRSARQALGLPLNAWVVGCVGRLVALKNHRMLIEAFAPFAQVHPEAHLLLLGDGVLRQELQALVDTLGLSARCTLAGERPNVSSLLPAMNVFVLPSRTEGVSIALLEACASQLPVIATRVGGNPEVVRHAHTGWLIESEDTQALTQALLTMQADAALCGKLGANAQQWVQEHASMQALEAAYGRIYAGAAGAAAAVAGLGGGSN
jgi:glycosyltransferase involved in cell wall biosynthesis